MSEIPGVVHEPATGQTDRGRTGRRRWQVGLRSLFLLMAAIAVWMAYFINLRHNATLRARIAAMIPIAHELVIGDATQISVVQLEPQWYDENRWDIYLPDANQRLCIATRGIHWSGLAPARQSAPIGAGRHQLELETKGVGDIWRVKVLWDGKELMAVEEPKDWKPGGSVGGGDYSSGQQLSPDEPAVLFRDRNLLKKISSSESPDDSWEGILLWIEPMGASKRPGG